MLHVDMCRCVGRRLDWRVFIVLGVYSWLPGVCHAQTKTRDEWRRTFFDEAPRKWQEYIAFSQRLQGTGTTIVRDDKGSTLLHSFMDLKRNANCGSVGGGAGNDWELTAFNTAYTFRLQRKSTDHPWVITGVEKRQSGVVDQDMRDTLEALSHRKMLHLSHTCELPDLVRQKTFHVVQAAQINRDGADLVRIDFDNRHPVSERPFFAVQWGVLLLDPARFWCPREGEITCKHPDGVTTTSETVTETNFDIVSRDAPGNYPIPVRRVETVVTKWSDKPAEKGIYTHDLKLEVPDRPPGDEEFTLSALGFKEPPWLQPDTPKPTRWWLWGALAGGALLALAAVFDWLRRRAR